MDIQNMLRLGKLPTYVSQLPPYGSMTIKCARCPRWNVATRKTLEEKGILRVEHVPHLLSHDCKYMGTASGCGAYLSARDIAVPETPPANMRYRWVSQLVQENLTLAVECSFCHRRSEVPPQELRKWIRDHAKGEDLALTEISERARCTAPDCGRRGAYLQWSGLTPAIVPPVRKKQGKTDHEARGSWRLRE